VNKNLPDARISYWRQKYSKAQSTNALAKGVQHVCVTCVRLPYGLLVLLHLEKMTCMFKWVDFVDRIQYFLLVDCIQVLEMLWLMHVLERLCQWHREWLACNVIEISRLAIQRCQNRVDERTKEKVLSQ
jgi:hypothetical protein